MKTEGIRRNNEKKTRHVADNAYDFSYAAPGASTGIITPCISSKACLLVRLSVVSYIEYQKNNNKKKVSGCIWAMH